MNMFKFKAYRERGREFDKWFRFCIFSGFYLQYHFLRLLLGNYYTSSCPVAFFFQYIFLTSHPHLHFHLIKLPPFWSIIHFQRHLLHKSCPYLVAQITRRDLLLQIYILQGHHCQIRRFHSAHWCHQHLHLSCLNFYYLRWLSIILFWY